MFTLVLVAGDVGLYYGNCFKTLLILLSGIFIIPFSEILLVSTIKTIKNFIEVKIDKKMIENNNFTKNKSAMKEIRNNYFSEKVIIKARELNELINMLPIDKREYYNNLVSSELKKYFSLNTLVECLEFLENIRIEVSRVLKEERNKMNSINEVNNITLLNTNDKVKKKVKIKNS